jgi:hypothetical protein
VLFRSKLINPEDTLKIIKLRDGNKCRKCGNESNDNVIALIDGDIKNNKISNTISLCKECFIESIKNRSLTKIKRSEFINWFLKDNKAEEERLKSLFEKFGELGH